MVRKLEVKNKGPYKLRPIRSVFYYRTLWVVYHLEQKKDMIVPDLEGNIPPLLTIASGHVLQQSIDDEIHYVLDSNLNFCRSGLEVDKRPMW